MRWVWPLLRLLWEWGALPDIHLGPWGSPSGWAGLTELLGHQDWPGVRTSWASSESLRSWGGPALVPNPAGPDLIRFCVLCFSSYDFQAVLSG